MARKMKDSGIEWIGEIPEGWSIARGKHILTLLQRAVFPTDGVITCFRDGEVTLRSNRREDGFTVSLKEIGYQGIEPGDLVVHGMDGFAGSIGISDSRGKSSPVLVVLDSSQDKKYLMYYLRSMAYNNVFLALSTGIRVRSCDLKWNKLADLLYLVPPIVEQHKLVSFLDEKCSEIDAILFKTRSSIEEYKKLKQAVITQAVTKGVRGEREMKGSGVEWIGEIPKEWGRTKIKMIASFFNGDRTSRYPQPSDFVDSGVAFLTSRNIDSDEVDLSETKYITDDKYKSLSGAKIQIDDIIFCLRGSVGKCAINRTLSCGTVASSLATIRPKDIPDDSTNHPSSVRSQDIIFHWENLVLSNISSNTCIISYIKINHSPYAFPIKSPLKSGEIFQITGNLMAIYIFPVIDSITLGVYDSNFNLYEYPLHFRLVDCPAEQKSKLPNIEKVIEFDTIDCQPDLLK